MVKRDKERRGYKIKAGLSKRSARKMEGRRESEETEVKQDKKCMCFEEKAEKEDRMRKGWKSEGWRQTVKEEEARM